MNSLGYLPISMIFAAKEYNHDSLVNLLARKYSDRIYIYIYIKSTGYTFYICLSFSHMYIHEWVPSYTHTHQKKNRFKVTHKLNIVAHHKLTLFWARLTQFWIWYVPYIFIFWYLIFHNACLKRSLCMCIFWGGEVFPHSEKNAVEIVVML